MDYHQAFDTAGKWTFLKAVKNVIIDFWNFMKNEYDAVTMNIQMETENIKLERGARQGDTILPELFTLVFEDLFKGLQSITIDR